MNQPLITKINSFESEPFYKERMKESTDKDLGSEIKGMLRRLRLDAYFSCEKVLIDERNGIYQYFITPAKENPYRFDNVAFYTQSDYDSLAHTENKWLLYEKAKVALISFISSDTVFKNFNPTYAHEYSFKT